MRPRDEKWLADVIARAETVDEAQLAVSVFLAGRSGLPLRPQWNVRFSDLAHMVASRFDFIRNEDRENNSTKKEVQYGREVSES